MDVVIPLSASLALAATVGPRVRSRLELSRAKHPSLRGHSRISRMLARLVPFYEYDEERFFSCDGAPPEVAATRRQALARLAEVYRERFAESSRWTAAAGPGLSDLQFTGAYRVPFQFRGHLGRHLPPATVVKSSCGVTLQDLDGNHLYDVSGSYGVNLFGHEFYKGTIERAVQRVGSLGAVLGPYHPVVADNVSRLRRISGLDEVSFHMSGTEAVMQAVRLARYHTGRSHVVVFCGAYHGWWDEVQPGVGSPRPARETYVLTDMAEASLRVLERRRDIACVLVNPLQALHPNASAPHDGALVDSSRSARFDRAAYTAWLQRLREVCTRRSIPLIFDEVFMGFRLAREGAQEYFGVAADLVTYGKSLGGGLPVGVLCGRRNYMKRFRDDRPADVCFARGTFNSHPYVMAAMNEFLRALESPEVQKLYDGIDDTWDARAARLNKRLAGEGLPVRVENMSSVWTVCYTQPSRYNWMFQYYLRAAGLLLPWIGTGRFIFSLDYTDAQFEEVADRFAGAARAMCADGWWWSDGSLTNRGIRRQVLGEMLGHLVGR